MMTSAMPVTSAGMPNNLATLGGKNDIPVGDNPKGSDFSDVILALLSQMFSADNPLGTDAIKSQADSSHSNLLDVLQKKLSSQEGSVNNSRMAGQNLLQWLMGLQEGNFALQQNNIAQQAMTGQSISGKSLLQRLQGLQDSQPALPILQESQLEEWKKYLTPALGVSIGIFQPHDANLLAVLASKGEESAPNPLMTNPLPAMAPKGLEPNPLMTNPLPALAPKGLEPNPLMTNPLPALAPKGLEPNPLMMNPLPALAPKGLEPNPLMTNPLPALAPKGLEPNPLMMNPLPALAPKGLEPNPLMMNPLPALAPKGLEPNPLMMNPLPALASLDFNSSLASFQNAGGLPANVPLFADPANGGAMQGLLSHNQYGSSIFNTFPLVFLQTSEPITLISMTKLDPKPELLNKGIALLDSVAMVGLSNDRSLSQIPMPYANFASNPASILPPSKFPFVAMPITPPNFSQDLSDRIQWMEKVGLSSMRLNLNPPQLGNLQVVITVNDANQGAHIQFVASTPQMVQALTNHFGDLRDQLAAFGFNNMSFDVGHRQKGDSQREFQAPLQGSQRYHLTEEDALPIAQIMMPARNGRVDDYA